MAGNASASVVAGAIRGRESTMTDNLFRASLLPWLVTLAASGCVTVYQPLTGLQRPVVVDPSVGNFPGLRLLVRCPPSEHLEPLEADRLCRSVGTLFSNQGAQVELEVPRGRSARSREGLPKPDLVMDLTTRLLHEENSALLWVASIATGTLVPAITDTSIAQDVTVRDGDGFLLAVDSLQARFVRYMGVAVWAVNGLLDLLVRSPADRVTGNAVQPQVSKDFYGQLSQLVLHAQLRSTVLGGMAAPPASEAP